MPSDSFIPYDLENNADYARITEAVRLGKRDGWREIENREDREAEWYKFQGAQQLESEITRTSLLLNRNIEAERVLGDILFSSSTLRRAEYITGIGNKAPEHAVEQGAIKAALKNILLQKTDMSKDQYSRFEMLQKTLLESSSIMIALLGNEAELNKFRAIKERNFAPVPERDGNMERVTPRNIHPLEQLRHQESLNQLTHEVLNRWSIKLPVRLDVWFARDSFAAAVDTGRAVEQSEKQIKR